MELGPFEKITFFPPDPLLKENASREVEALLFVVAEGKKAAAEPMRREARGNIIVVLIVCDEECRGK